MKKRKVIWNEEDETKNLKEYGISFRDLEGIFDDSFSVVMEDPDDERNHLILGFSASLKKFVVGQYEEKENGEVLLKAARKAVKNEIRWYETE